MARIGLLVTLTASPGCREQLLKRLEKHAVTTLSRERGCMTFDILLPTESEDEVRLVEIYLSEEALEAHRNTAHLAAFRADTKDWVVAREIVECELQVQRR